ncbi:prolyl 4-hydroxylase [Thiothrix caldifontis]|uniref:Prolyl 4-hydroxylase n=2 Tax=Thiothrix caldifontis TaxID=525918 RepID=A0A1H4DP02_9GAMM|nr:prolyl 4-hydroxylase [Thiothrix caldifontis]
MLAMDQEWKSWLDTNLARQCDVENIYRIMRTNGFNPSTIQQMMGDVYPAGIETQPIKTNTNFDYQTLSKVMEVRGLALGAQRVDTDALQIYTIDNFLSPSECEQVIAITKQNLSPSLVSHYNGDPAFRTSMTCHLRYNEDPFIDYIDERIARTLGICLSYSEAIQAQHYEVGKELKAHHDYFTPNTPAYAEFADEKGQRTWTFMVYLNNTPKGGGTHFVYMDHTFYPKQGQAVIWNNLYPDGLPNRQTLHHGMPVEEGEKTIITKWFRDKGQGDVFCEQMSPS